MQIINLQMLLYLFAVERLLNKQIIYRRKILWPIIFYVQAQIFIW